MGPEGDIMWPAGGIFPVARGHGCDIDIIIYKGGYYNARGISRPRPAYWISVLSISRPRAAYCPLNFYLANYFYCTNLIDATL